MKRAYAYLRASTDRQDASAPAQREAITEFCRREGIEVVEWFLDDGVSGKSFERPNYRRMRALIGGGNPEHVDHVVVWSLSRFARVDPDDFIVEKRDLAKAGVSIVSTTEPIRGEKGIADGLLSYISAHQNHEFLVKLSKDVTRGMRSLVQNGFWPSVSPLGYDRLVVDDGHNPVVVNGQPLILKRGQLKGSQNHVILVPGGEAEQAAIRFMFEKRAYEQWGLRRIAAELNETGIKTIKGKPWQQTTVRSCLTNVSYLGHTRYGVRRKYKGIQLLSETFRLSEVEKFDSGRYLYDRSMRLQPLGVYVYWDSTAERSKRLHRDRFCVDIAGSALDGLSGSAVLKLVRRLVFEFWMLGSRTDAAFDDRGRTIAPFEVAEVAKRDDFTGFRRFKHDEPMRLGGIREGDQVTFGRRGRDGSGKLLRVYDKGLESDGENDSVRWEVELSKDRAREAVFQLAQCKSVEQFAGLLGGLIGGAIDFVSRTDRVGDKNVCRLERLKWWGEIVEVLGKVVLAIDRPGVRVEKSREWVQESVATVLAMLETAVGEDKFARWFAVLLEQGRLKLKPRHRGALKEFWGRGWEDWICN